MALATVVHTVDLAKERDKCVDEMIKKMEDNGNPGHKRIFQKLPKHLRRRAMSYDIRKVPKTMRPVVEAQVAGAAEAKARNKTKGRDSNKYRTHGKNQAIHRNSEFRWLETHVWHAKRFHMKDLWGWKIPTAPTMKQTRNLIKMTAENCTFRDISFTILISINAEQPKIVQRLLEITRPNVRIETNLHLLFDVEIFKTFPNSPVGPVQLFWVSNQKLWILLHPVLKEGILELFDESFSPEVIDGEFNIFEFYGPNSTNVIKSVCHPSDKDEIAQTFLSLPHPSAVIPGFSIALNISDPRTVQDTPDPEANTNFSLTDIPPSLCESPLFTNRGINFPSEKEFNTNRAKLLFPSAEGPSGAVPIILMQRFSFHPKGFGSNWLLLIPFGCGNVFWTKFIHQGARPFGMELERLIDLESGRFNFPFCRPDTNEGLQIFTAEYMEIITNNEKKPNGKRIDTTIFDLPSDFYISNDQTENSFLRVSIKMVNRGTPMRFSTIYAPEPGDFNLINQIVEIKGERRPIGIVLDGNNSLLAGEGKGLGLVKSSEILSVLPEIERSHNLDYSHRPKQSLLVVIREMGSQFLHLAWISVHPSNFYQ